jgi:hypothetical protein
MTSFLKGPKIFNKSSNIPVRSVSSLKNQMEKEKNIHRQEYLRKMRENGFLLQVKNKPGLPKAVSDWMISYY